jgi:hypothetical protein
MTEQHRITRLNDTPLPIDANAIVCYITIQNELPRLPDLLAYYRRLGVDRFIILDNHSTDGGVDYLVAQPDIHLYGTRASFAKSRCGVLWTNHLLDKLCRDRWCLVVDADEYFVFPECERLGLRHLCNYLDDRGDEAVSAIMIDRYSRKAMNQIEDTQGQSLRRSYPYFDSTGYQVHQETSKFPAFKIIGGPRNRVLWDTLKPGFPPPIINKVPLIKWRKGAGLLKSTHFIHPMKLALLRGALMHFKFTGDFKARVLNAVREGNHAMNSREYKVYLRALTTVGDRSLMYPGSVQYTGSRQLSDLKLVYAPEDYYTYT